MTHENENTESTEPVEPGGDAPRTYTSGDVVKITVGIILNDGESVNTFSEKRVGVVSATDSSVSTVSVGSMDIVDVLLSSIERLTSSFTTDVSIEDVVYDHDTPRRLRELAARMSGAYASTISLAHFIEHHVLDAERE